MPDGSVVIALWSCAGGRCGAGAKRDADPEKENPAKKLKTVQSTAKGGAGCRSDTAAAKAASTTPPKSPANSNKGGKRPRKADGALRVSTNAVEDVIVGSGRQVGLSTTILQDMFGRVAVYMNIDFRQWS